MKCPAPSIWFYCIIIENPVIDLVDVLPLQTNCLCVASETLRTVSCDT